MDRRATRSAAAKGLLVGKQNLVLSPNVQRVKRDLGHLRDSLDITRNLRQRNTIVKNGNGGVGCDEENHHEVENHLFSDNIRLNESSSSSSDSEFPDVRLGVEAPPTPPTKEQQARIELIMNALKKWDRKLDIKLLFIPDTWMRLISSVVEGTPEARKYKNQDRLRKFATVVIEQISSKNYQRQVANELASLGRGNSKGVKKSNRILKTFLEHCLNYEEEMSKKRWKETQGGEYPSVISVEAEASKSFDGFVTDDSIHKDDRVLDADELGKLTDYGEEEDDDDFQQEKENSLRNGVVSKRTISRAQRRDTKDRKNNSAVKMEKASSKVTKRKTKIYYKNSRSAANVQSSNRVNTTYDSDKILSAVKTTSPSPRTSGEDEIIENPTPPATPLSDINNDAPSPAKKSRRSSDETVETIIETRRPIRRCGGNSAVIGNTGRLDREVHGFDYFQAKEALGIDENGTNPSDDDDFKSNRNPSPPLEQDKENLPKSPEEIARAYPKPPGCPDLTPAMFQEMKECLSNPELQTKKKSTIINAELLSVYDKPEWLEDAHIDYYLELIKERNLRKEEYPKVYTFQCYFYKLLEKSGFSVIKGATDKENIFTHDLVMIPIHSNHHWILIVMDTNNKRLTCYDSMDHNNAKHINIVQEYLLEEWNRLIEKQRRRTSDAVGRWRELFDSKKDPNSIWEDSGWKVDDFGREDIPQQKNGRDCGIFLLQFAEYLSRNKTFDFEQKHTAYFRKRMMFETLKGYLLVD